MITLDHWSWKKRVGFGLWGIGYTANYLIIPGFKWSFYSAVIWHLGLVQGAGVMWALSFLVCYATMRFYNWSKTDWLGIETLKNIRERGAEGENRFCRIWGRTLSKGNPVALLILSVTSNAFLCTVYMRSAYEYKIMTRRDWEIFSVSFVLSNTFRTAIVFSGLTAVQWMIHAVKLVF